MISFKNLYKKLFEEKNKEITILFGRLSPPTKGHEIMVKFAHNHAKKHKTDLTLYPSQTQDKKKNPLDIKTKVKYLKKFFPFIPVVVRPKLKTPFMIIDHLLEVQGYSKIYFIVGGDRKSEFTVIFKKYFEGKVLVVNSGGRTKGISATDLRNAAQEDDFDTFKKGLPSSAKIIDAQQLFKKVQSGLK